LHLDEFLKGGNYDFQKKNSKSRENFWKVWGGS